MVRCVRLESCQTAANPSGNADASRHDEAMPTRIVRRAAIVSRLAGSALQSGIVALAHQWAGSAEAERLAATQVRVAPDESQASDRSEAWDGAQVAAHRRLPGANAVEVAG